MDWAALSITFPQAVLVVAATIGAYLVLLVLARLWGPRSLARLSTFDAMFLLMIGPIAGRVVLGKTTSLSAGIVSLVTLFVLRLITARVRATRQGSRVVRNRPVILMTESGVDRQAMARTRISRADLNAALRTAGVSRAGDVVCVILESAGGLSVVTRGTSLDRRIFEDVDGIEKLPAEAFAGSEDAPPGER